MVSELASIYLALGVSRMKGSLAVQSGVMWGVKSYPVLLPRTPRDALLLRAGGIRLDAFNGDLTQSLALRWAPRWPWCDFGSAPPLLPPRGVGFASLGKKPETY